MAVEEKFDRLTQLMTMGKEKGYVLYDEVNELLTDDLNGGAELDDLLTDLDTAGVEILEEPKLDSPKTRGSRRAPRSRPAAQDFSDKTNDPVRMYLREMGTVPLLTREGEIELAKRIERGQTAVRKALSRSPLVIRKIIGMGEEVERGTLAVARPGADSRPGGHRRNSRREEAASSWAPSTKSTSITRKRSSSARSCRPSRAA